MVTLNQLRKFPRRRKRTKLSFFRHNPQKKGVCLRVYTTKPKKPNSAVRKIAKVRFRDLKRNALVCIPGQGHSLGVHSVVLVRGGRVRDIPGVHFKMIRGKYDFTSSEKIVRSRKRSKYGLSGKKD